MADSYFLQVYHKIRVTLMRSPPVFSHRQRSNLDSTTVGLKPATLTEDHKEPDPDFFLQILKPRRTVCMHA